MSRQYDNVFIKPSDDGAIIQCMCGEVSHGQIDVFVDAVPVNEEKEWWWQWTGYFKFRFRPYWKQRLKTCWAVLTNRYIECDFEMSALQAQEFALWLARKGAEGYNKEQQRPTTLAETQKARSMSAEEVEAFKARWNAFVSAPRQEWNLSVIEDEVASWGNAP